MHGPFWVGFMEEIMAKNTIYIYHSNDEYTFAKSAKLKVEIIELDTWLLDSEQCTCPIAEGLAHAHKVVK
jgi:hypothetical protein